MLERSRKASAPANILIALIVTVAALSAASSVFAPVAFALFIVMLMWPLQRKLQAVLPRLVALAVSVCVVIAALLVLGSLVSGAFSHVGRSIVSDASRFQAFYDQAVVWLEGHGLTIAGDLRDTFNVAWLIRVAQTVTSRLNSTVNFWLVVLVYVVLGLLEVDEFKRKLRGMGNREAGDIMLRGSMATASKIRRYMVVRTAMSIVTGMLVWAFAKAVGLQLAEQWGVIAFSLNYIPVLGPLIATVFPTLFAMTQFESWGTVIAIFACLNVIQFVVGSYVEPRVAGRALAISPVAVLFSVFFWSYIWGIFGAFIGVPMTIALVTFCAAHPSSAWVAELFGAAEKDDRPAGSAPTLASP